MTIIANFARSWFPPMFVAFGAVSIALGYFYDLLYVAPSNPGDDAPLQLQLQFDRNHVFVHRVEAAGLLLVAVGVALLAAQVVIRLIMKVRGRRHSSPARPL